MLKVLRKQIVLVVVFIILMISMVIYLFYQNVQLTKQLSLKPKEIMKERTVNVQKEDEPVDLLDRCGDYPQIVTKKAYSTGYHTKARPIWSPDCRHIAWSVTIVAMGLMGEDQPPNGEELRMAAIKRNQVLGVYLYDDHTKQISKIFQLSELDIENARKKGYGEDAKFLGWVDSKRLKFETYKGIFIYTLDLKTIDPE